MNDNDQTAEKMANIVLDVYRYALDNKMDITSHDDVLKILDVLKIYNSSGINIDTLIEGLVALDKMTKENVAKRKDPVNN